MPRHYPRRWWSRHTVIQSGKHLKIFVMKRVQRCPFSRANKKKTMAPFSIWSSLSQCGRTCVRFQHNTADDKIAYEKRQMAAVTLLGGPTSTWHIEPVNDYFCISQQFFFFFSRVRLIYRAIKYQSWCSALIWGFSLSENCSIILCICLNHFQLSKVTNPSFQHMQSVWVYVPLHHSFSVFGFQNT